MSFDRNSVAFGTHLDHPTKEVKQLPIKHSSCPEIVHHCECLNKHNPKTFSLEMINDLTLHVSIVSDDLDINTVTHTVTDLEGLVCTRCRRISIVGEGFSQIFKSTLIHECGSVEDFRRKLESIEIVDKEHKVSYDPKKLAMYNMSSATRIKDIETIVIQRPRLVEKTPYTNLLLSIAGHWRKVHVISDINLEWLDIASSTTETVLGIFDNCFKVTNEESFNNYVRPLDIRDADGKRYTLSCETAVEEFSLRSKETRDRLIPHIQLKLRMIM